MSNSSPHFILHRRRLAAWTELLHAFDGAPCMFCFGCQATSRTLSILHISWNCRRPTQNHNYHISCWRELSFDEIVITRNCDHRNCDHASLFVDSVRLSWFLEKEVRISWKIIHYVQLLCQIPLLTLERSRFKIKSAIHWTSSNCNILAVD